MMRATRPASGLLAHILCLVLSDALLISLFAPFIVGRAGAALGHVSKTKSTSATSPAKSKGGWRSGELLIRFRDGLSDQEKDTLVAAKGARRLKKLSGPSRLEKIGLAAGQNPLAIAAELRLNPAVLIAEPNYLISSDETVPDDPSFSEQWALRNTGQSGGQEGADIGAAMAWDTTTGAPSTVIAVIDSGIDFMHPDLLNNQWTNLAEQANGVDDDQNGLIDDLHGWDWVTGSSEIRDGQGHGTSMAGIIAAEGDNAIGMTGVMWHASLMSLRVLDNTGTGDVARAVEAIDYAVARGAKTINCSWGTDEESSILREAMQRASNADVLVVCSAGNGARNIESVPYYPASFGLSNMLAVAATDRFDHLLSSSNWGATHVTVAAPGADVMSTQMGGGYRLITGTSASAPLVSGVAGLIKTARPGLSAAGTKRAIRDGVRPVTELAEKISSGGVVSAPGALTSLPDTEPTPTPTPEPSPTPTPGDGGGKSVPGSNLPDLDVARNIEPVDPVAPVFIHSDLSCTIDAGEPPAGTGLDPDLSTARTLPENETGRPGVNLRSLNHNWSTTLVSLPGRAGLDLGITLAYNSLVWTKDGPVIRFNTDHGFPGPGFRLGFPTIQRRYFNPQVGGYAYMMVTASGAHVELRQVGTSNIYEAADSSLMQMTDNGASGAVVRMPDGAQMTYGPPRAAYNNEMRCTQIKDRNGNYVTATYNTAGQITRITDTLGRNLDFNYDTGGYLTKIRQLWNNGTAVHDLATFGYGTITAQTGFATGMLVQGPQNGACVTVLTQVGMEDGSSYKFEYTSWGQVNRISRISPRGEILNYVSYNMDISAGQSDCPRFTEQRVWTRNWNGDTDGEAASSEEALTIYSRDTGGAWSQEIRPDLTLYKEFYATTSWQRGLVTETETWSGSLRVKHTTTLWTQDDETVSYRINPRVKETNIYDELNHRRRTTITYLPVSDYSLPSDVKEYDANGTTVLRSTHTEYILSNAYTSRRIIGLVREVDLYKGDSSDTAARVLFSKVTYRYDQATPVDQGEPVRHDVAYGTNLSVGRGNVTGVLRWDANAPTDSTRVLESNMSYNTTGSLIATRDPSLHLTVISYADMYYSDTVNHNTLAYPTQITNPDGYTATTEYEYDTGAVRHTSRPSSGTGTSITYEDMLYTYDGAARIMQALNQDSGERTRWVYPDTLLSVNRFRTIEAGLGEAYSTDVLDGAGRVRVASGDHPASTGLYRGRAFIYNNMGWTAQRSSPTETDNNFVAMGDDDPNTGGAGWRYTQQQYDWNGRPTVVSNDTDDSTSIISYQGCGCAGGAQTTVTDPRGRQRRMTMDVVGRLVKVEELNFDGTVYATTTYTYDVLDHPLTINHGAGSNVRQYSFIYDGYGRLASRTSPEQGTTSYTYHADDRLDVVTDARGTTTTYSYNNRHLVTGISYGESAGVASTPDVTFTYDAGGNRESMTDGLGSVEYTYNERSQLMTETRTFTNVPGSPFTFRYRYNLAGQLISVGNPWNTQVGYEHDKLGRVIKVTGAGYAGVTSYVNSIGYRAFGVKSVGYPNAHVLSMSYDPRKRMTDWKIDGVLGWHYSYTATRNSRLQEKGSRVVFADSLTAGEGNLDRSYEYDQVGRLVESHSGAEARAHFNGTTTTTEDGPYSGKYIYDIWGNMKERQGRGVENAQYVATFNSKNRMVVNPATGTGMQYDAAGNLTNDGFEKFTYNAMGQQATVTPAGTTTATLVNSYDGDGLRVKKVENGATTYYLRSSMLGNQVNAEIDEQGVRKRSYVYLGGQLLALLENNAVTWVHQDPITKSQRFTDSSGAVLGSKIDLDPWGAETTATVNPQIQSHRFTTYERDANGSDDAMHRRYNSVWGRFDQPDPAPSQSLGNPQSFNRYAYVGNDPVNRVDPTGLFSDATGGCSALNGFAGCSGGGDSGIILYADAGTIYSGSSNAFGSESLMDFYLESVLGFGNEGLYSLGDVGTVDVFGGPDPLDETFLNHSPQNPGGLFDADEQADVDDLKISVRELLKNPDCARVLGGVRSAQRLLNRARVLNANTLGRSYSGTGGLYPAAANTARSEANNLQSEFLAYSESRPFASTNGRTVLPRNIYLFDRFFTNIGPSQQETVFIHELNRLGGYSGGYRDDYANITAACGTADPFGPNQ